VTVYELTGDGPLSKDFALRDQMRRAALSICSNIAEGNERNTDRDTIRFLYIAKGSSAELMAQAEIAISVGLLGESAARKLAENCEEIAKMLRGLIKYREGKD
jgi:four helix bundle protein